MQLSGKETLRAPAFAQSNSAKMRHFGLGFFLPQEIASVSASYFRDIPNLDQCNWAEMRHFERQQIKTTINATSTRPDDDTAFAWLPVPGNMVFHYRILTGRSNPNITSPGAPHRWIVPRPPLRLFFFLRNRSADLPFRFLRIDHSSQSLSFWANATRQSSSSAWRCLPSRLGPPSGCNTCGNWPQKSAIFFNFFRVCSIWMVSTCRMVVNLCGRFPHELHSLDRAPGWPGSIPHQYKPWIRYSNLKTNFFLNIKKNKF